jgi:hypothetical protein
MREKECNDCKIIKAIYNFNKDKSRVDGYSYRCKDCQRLRTKNNYHKNKEHYKLYGKEYRENNPDKLKNKRLKYKSRKNELQKYHYHSNGVYKVIQNIRSRLGYAFKSVGYTKIKSTLECIGCDYETLMEHLQNTGEIYDSNFNVYDYDSSLYHIDHKKTFADVQKGIYTLDEVCHYTNLQILPADINLSKGGNSW